MVQKSLKIALAQFNPTLGDIEGNLSKARIARQKAAEFEADLIVFGKFFLSGFPPQELLLNKTFIQQCRTACEAFALETVDKGPAVLMTVPWQDEEQIYPAILLLKDGDLTLTHSGKICSTGNFWNKGMMLLHQQQLPELITFDKIRIGVPIGDECLDSTVINQLVKAGAEIILSPQGSAYWRGHHNERKHIIEHLANENNIPITLMNLVGGQDNLVFDGASFIINADGQTAVQQPAFQESLLVATWENDGDAWKCIKNQIFPYPSDEKSDYTAAMLGLRDYMHKCGFENAVLGMSGGIDSALVATLAADAIGPENVLCVMLPSKFTSQTSLHDAKECAQNLRARYEVVSILPVVDGAESTLLSLFSGYSHDVTEENIQARSRGLLLMAISNKFDTLLLSTGNKSEGAVGYATLYGDMCGGFNPITDLYKTRVYELCKIRNTWKPEGALGRDGEMIPLSILTKAPSAELREGQKDQDSLPPYDILDDILIQWVENRRTVSEIVTSGHAPDTIKKVVRLVHLAEYKRRQATMGPKLTKVMFGYDRNIPVVHHFKG